MSSGVIPQNLGWWRHLLGPYSGGSLSLMGQAHYTFILRWLVDRLLLFLSRRWDKCRGGVFVLWLWKWLVASLHLEKLSWSKLYPSLMSYINCRIHLQAWLWFSPAPKCNSVPFQSLIQPRTQMLWWSGQGSDDIWIQTQMWFRPGLECDLVQNPKSLPSWTQYGIWSQNLMWFGPWPKYNSVLDPSVIWSWTQMRSPPPPDQSYTKYHFGPVPNMVFGPMIQSWTQIIFCPTSKLHPK